MRAAATSGAGMRNRQAFLKLRIAGAFATYRPSHGISASALAARRRNPEHGSSSAFAAVIISVACVATESNHKIVATSRVPRALDMPDNESRADRTKQRKAEPESS